MKRKTAATDTLTTQRLVLTAPDGSPRAELALDEHTRPTLRMFDPSGLCRIEVGLQVMHEDGEPDMDWPEIKLTDSRGRRMLLIQAMDDRFRASASVRDVQFSSLDVALGGEA